MTELLRRILQVTLPLVVLGLGLAVAVALARSREEVPSVTPRAAVPLVRVVTAASTSWRARVHATGVVEPAARSDLVAEVGGRVIEVGASLADGAFFTAGEILVRLDARDHELAVVEAQSRVAEAQLALAFEEAEAESARREWQAMQRPEPPPPLVVRAPQLAEARARLAAAEARLEAAEREVERCVVRAPYDGRVLDKAVDLGQFVTRGTLLARVYATAAAEILLPVPDSELAFLDLRLDSGIAAAERGELADARGPAVEVFADFAGRRHRWQGQVVRTQGQLDPASRMLHLVARVEHPYRLDGGRSAPLLVNQFVSADVIGTEFEDVVVLPLAALRGTDQVLVVDAGDRLQQRRVEVLRKDRDRIVLRSGVAAGERVVVTPLELVVDGMPVEVDELPLTEPGPASDPQAERDR